MTLANLALGGRGKIISIHTSTERLRQMGLVEGSTLEMAYLAPFGGTLAVKCRGSLIAMRVSDAEKIEVEAIDRE